MLNLNTCVKGQKLLLRRGRIVTYVYKDTSSTFSHKTRTQEGHYISYPCDGTYNGESGLDVIEILPLETTDKHPSIAWWESCPWITDRKPTKEDSDHLGQVIQQVSSKTGTTLDLCFISWAYVKEDQAWIHSLNWKPLKQTPKEKALALIAKHKDGSTIGVWVPTPDDWNVIREGLKAS